MTATIPEEAMKAARAVVERGYNEGLIVAVALALLARDERAAKIAESCMLEADDREEPGDDDWWTRSAANGQATIIASAIRDRTKP